MKRSFPENERQSRATCTHVVFLRGQAATSFMPSSPRATIRFGQEKSRHGWLWVSNASKKNTRSSGMFFPGHAQRGFKYQNANWNVYRSKTSDTRKQAEYLWKKSKNNTWRQSSFFPCWLTVTVAVVFARSCFTNTKGTPQKKIDARLRNLFESVWRNRTSV